MNDEIYAQIDSDYEYDKVMKKPVFHFEPKGRGAPNRASELVYGFLGSRRCGLLYMVANNLTSEYLLAGHQLWVPESKLKGILDWGRENHVHPMALVKVINKEIKSIKKI
jgi:hypothetical protein